MPILPIFDVGRLARFFSRDRPRDQFETAEHGIDYAKKHGIIGADDEPGLARELAPRKVRRALRKAERKQQTADSGEDKKLSEELSPGIPILDPRDQPLLLPPPTENRQPGSPNKSRGEHTDRDFDSGME